MSSATSLKDLFGSSAVAKALPGDRPFTLYGLPLIPGLSNEHYQRACEVYDMLIYDDSIEEAEPLYWEFLSMCAEDHVELPKAIACLARTVKASKSGADLPDVDSWITQIVMKDLGASDEELKIAAAEAEELNETIRKKKQAKAADEAARKAEQEAKEANSIRNRIFKKKSKKEEEQSTSIIPVNESKYENTKSDIIDTVAVVVDDANNGNENNHDTVAAVDAKSEGGTTESDKAKATPKKEQNTKIKESTTATPVKEEISESNSSSINEKDANKIVEQFNISNFVQDNGDKVAKKDAATFDINKFTNGDAIYSNQPVQQPNVEPIPQQPVDNAQATPQYPNGYQNITMNPMLIAMMQRQQQNNNNTVHFPYMQPNSLNMNPNVQSVQQPQVNPNDQAFVNQQNVPMQQPASENACSCGDPNCTGHHEVNYTNEEEAKKHTHSEIPDPDPELSDEQKAAYVKKHIEFLEGAHCGENAVTITQLNSIYSMLKGSELKKYLKKFKSKARPSNPYMYEVPMSKYAVPDDGDLYDITFEAPCAEVDGKKAKIVIKFGMEPVWNDITKCYANNFTAYRKVSDRGADTKSKSSGKSNIEFTTDKSNK